MIEQYLAYSGFWDSGNSDDPMVKGGQIEYKTPGTVEWTVPEGVTEISVVMVSAGLQGRVQSVAAANAGAGGCVRWMNNIPVVAGEKYTLVVGNGGISQSIPYGTASSHQTDHKSNGFGLVVGINTIESTAIGSGVGGTNSFGGGAGGGSSGDVIGGDSGTFISSGGTSSGGGTSPLGIRVARFGLVGGNYGGGGGAQLRDTGTRQTGKGGDGLIRIMWGNGRAYPSTNIADRV